MDTRHKDSNQQQYIYLHILSKKKKKRKLYMLWDKPHKHKCNLLDMWNSVVVPCSSTRNNDFDVLCKGSHVTTYRNI